MATTLTDYWQLLSRYLRAQVGAVLLLASLVAGNVGLQLLGPQILRYFVDTATAGGALQTLTIAAAVYLGAAAAQQLVSVAVAYAGETVAWRATNALRADLALHCLRLDPLFHQAHPPGELIERIDGDVNALANFFSQFLLLLVANALFLAGMLVLITREQWLIGVCFALYSAMMFALLSRMQRRIVPLIRATSQAGADLFAFIEERLGGTEDLKTRGAGPYVLRRFHEYARARFDRVVAYQRSTPNVVLSFAQAVFVGGNAVSLALGATFYARGELTLGTVFMIYQYFNPLSQAIRGLVDQLQDFQRATASIHRLGELTRLTSSVWDGTEDAPFGAARSPHPTGASGSEASETTALPDGPLPLELEHVSFSYPGSRPVLHDLSLSLEAGRTLGLLGRTGSGKTTIGRLLARVYDPTMGFVRLAGEDLRRVSPAEVRRRVGVVTQDVQLLNASVRDNLTLFDATVSDAQLRDVLETLGLAPWLRRLSAGLDTRLAPGGSDLSAGEAQLLAFARVFLRDPGLVLLDEASSRLDPATEALVERAAARLLTGRSAVVIAHRLTTVQRADDVLIVEDGRAIEHGPRAALAADPDSRFSRLLRTGAHEVRV